MCLIKRMFYLRPFLLLLALAALSLTGCSSNDTSPTGNVDANGQPVSSVPWNRPESWETTGQLGGAMGQ